MKNWRDLKRHPLSAEYRNLKGKPLKRLQESVRRRFLAERPITLYEGQVLDGWQRLVVCGEEGVEPSFVEFDPTDYGMTAEEYVESVNDARRQETPDQIEARAKKRKARAAELRAEGMSTRQIAEELETSPSTVARDLAESTVPGGTPEQIKGKDGKLHPAKADAPKRCQNCKRKGQVKNCEACAKLNKPKKKKSGQPSYSWAMFRSGLATVKKATGILTREVDKVGTLYDAKESPRAKQLRSRLAELEKQYKEDYEKDFMAWYRDLTAQTPKG